MPFEACISLGLKRGRGSPSKEADAPPRFVRPRGNRGIDGNDDNDEHENSDDDEETGANPLLVDLARVNQVARILIILNTHENLVELVAHEENRFIRQPLIARLDATQLMQQTWRASVMGDGDSDDDGRADASAMLPADLEAHFPTYITRYVLPLLRSQDSIMRVSIERPPATSDGERRLLDEIDAVLTAQSPYDILWLRYREEERFIGLHDNVRMYFKYVLVFEYYVDDDENFIDLISNSLDGFPAALAERMRVRRLPPPTQLLAGDENRAFLEPLVFDYTALLNEYTAQERGNAERAKERVRVELEQARDRHAVVVELRGDFFAKSVVAIYNRHSDFIYVRKRTLKL